MRGLAAFLAFLFLPPLLLSLAPPGSGEEEWVCLTRGPEGAWLAVAFDWEPVPQGEMDSGDVPRYNPDHTFYPGDLVPLKVWVEPVGRYDKVEISSPALERRVEGPAADRAYRLPVSGSASPGEHGVRVTLRPAKAKLTIKITTKEAGDFPFWPENLGVGYGVYVDNSLVDTYRGELVQTTWRIEVEQGEHTIEIREAGGEMRSFFPPARAGWFKPGEEYELVAVYCVEYPVDPDPQPPRWEKFECEGPFEPYPPLECEAKVKVVEYRPKFVVLPYFWRAADREEELVTNVRMAVLVKYLGNEYEPEKFSLAQRATVAGVRLSGVAVFAYMTENGAAEDNYLYSPERVEHRWGHEKATYIVGENMVVVLPGFCTLKENLVRFEKAVVFGENYAKHRFWVRTLKNTSYGGRGWDSENWLVHLSAEYVDEAERGTFSADLAWGLIGLRQEVEVAVWDVAPWLDPDANPRALLEENAWTVDGEAGWEVSFTPLVRFEEVMERVDLEYFLPGVDEEMLRQMAREACLENEPVQAMSGPGRGTFHIERYGGELFLREVTGRKGEVEGKKVEVVTVPFAGTMRIDICLTGRGMAAEAKDHGEYTDFLIYSPRGGLKEVAVIDNENRLLERREYTGMDSIFLLLGSGAPDVFEYRYYKKGKPTQVKLRLTNTYGVSRETPFFDLLPYTPEPVLWLKKALVYLTLGVLAVMAWNAFLRSRGWGGGGFISPSRQGE